MIKTFKNKHLSELFENGNSSKVAKNLHRRILVRLDRLHQVQSLGELKLPGFDFHALNGYNPTRYTIHINGPWCITFEFDGQDVWNVDLEQYH